MYELRECFEPAASRFAAERASDADHAAIWKAYERLAASKETGGDQSVVADVDFHVAILRSAHNDLLASFANVIESTLEASFVVARIRRNLSEDDVAQHAAVAKAILKRNGAAAKRATERLIEKSKATQIPEGRVLRRCGCKAQQSRGGGTSGGQKGGRHATKAAATSRPVLGPKCAQAEAGLITLPSS